MTRIIGGVFVVCSLALVACGTSGTSEVGSAKTVTTTVAPTTTGAPTTTAAPTPAADATAIAQDLKNNIGSIQKIVTVTEDNDPNDKIGRPNGYVSAAVIYDSGADCGEDLGVDCGATVEVWPSADDAKARSDYIQGILKDAPILGSEYNYLEGAALLRVTGGIKPTVAKEYQDALAD